MKYKVKVGDRTFEVEVSDIDARPIVALVEGERFEVWPETETAVPSPAPEGAPSIGIAAPARTSAAPRPTRRTSGEASAPPGSAGKVVYAPIPGVLESVAVHPGDTVDVGQALCVLEAMKMKNVIRASRKGSISEVYVTPGQHVKHNDALMEYGDL
ncbi:MAG: biotin/lipoyl-containing protein [Anaerolineae bacterium]